MQQLAVDTLYMDSTKCVLKLYVLQFFCKLYRIFYIHLDVTLTVTLDS